MMSHKIGFCGEVWPIIPKLSLLPLLIWSTEKERDGLHLSYAVPVIWWAPNPLASAATKLQETVTFTLLPLDPPQCIFVVLVPSRTKDHHVAFVSSLSCSDTICCINPIAIRRAKTTHS